MYLYFVISGYPCLYPYLCVVHFPSTNRSDELLHVTEGLIVRLITNTQPPCKLEEQWKSFLSLKIAQCFALKKVFAGQILSRFHCLQVCLSCGIAGNLYPVSKQCRPTVGSMNQLKVIWNPDVKLKIGQIIEDRGIHLKDFYRVD